MERSGELTDSRPVGVNLPSTCPAISETIDLGWAVDSLGRIVTEPAASRGWQPEPGQAIGRYRLVEPLGSGNQAVVWRASHEARPGHEVALKLLATCSAGDPKGVSRLRREARRGKRLRGPAILAVSDFGIEDGVAFMAMPLVEGGTLADVLDARQHRPRRPAGADTIWLATLSDKAFLPALTGVIAQVARGLQTAHDGNVIHCDIKPANILMDRRRPDQVFLADFGMGRDLDAQAPGQHWDLSGTPRFMAPELLLGRPADGMLCDIYALGVTLYEAVTGVHPCQVAGSESPLTEELARLAAHVPARVGEVAPRVPRLLGAIIERAMARDPGRRYPHASALAEALERSLTSFAPLRRPGRAGTRSASRGGQIRDRHRRA